MTKAERIFKDTRYECGRHYKAWGREYNPNGKPVTFGSLITEETVSTRTFNAVQKEIDKDRKDLEIAERLGALTPEWIEERRYVLDMVQTTLDNNRKSYNEFIESLKA